MAPATFVPVAAILAILLSAGCAAHTVGAVGLEDGTVLSAQEVARLESLHPRAAEIVEAVTDADPALGDGDGLAGAGVTDAQWLAIEAGFADLLRQESGLAYDTFPVVASPACRR